MPQTGDSYMVLVWAGLIAAALLAGLAALLLYRRWANGTTRRRTVAAISVVLCLALVLAGAGLVLNEYLHYKKGADSYAGIQLAATEGGDYPNSGSRTPAERAAQAVDFDALRAMNPEVAGWLVCEGTELNYPIVQSTDNTKYLDTFFDGSKGKAGCLFVDYENSPGFRDKNTVVYGHNLLDGSMLSGVLHYRQHGYYDTYPAMTLHTLEGSHTVELFAGYTARTSDDAWLLSWADDAAFSVWLEHVQGRSAFESDVVVSPGDRVLTLSTCTGNGRDRFVLHGRLVPES